MISGGSVSFGPGMVLRESRSVIITEKDWLDHCNPEFIVHYAIDDYDQPNPSW